MSQTALEAINISKHFGDLQALQNVSLELNQQSFHALIGENGAGKSTLVKCIMGYYHADEGELLVQGKQQTMNNPHEAHDVGIGMVYQHFTLIPNMTVAENFILARSKLPTIINWQTEIEALEQKMQNMPFDIDLSAKVNDLSAGEKQKVEIVKQLLLDIKILILDEPTSVLTPTEADEVLGTIKQLTQSHNLSVLMISHKFKEVMTYSDAVTVLRKGEQVASLATADCNQTQLAKLMIGSEISSQNQERVSQQGAEVMLQIKDLEVVNQSGIKCIDGLSLELHKGEILGIAGVSGNGQRELMEVLAGQRPSRSGEITVNKKKYHATREQIHRLKIHCLPEEPLINACVANMSVYENLALRNFDQDQFTRGKWILNRPAMVEQAKSLIEKFSIKTPGPYAPIGALSGGNVQRCVLAREITEDVDILIIANPCFGLDFNAVAQTRNRIMQARNKGAAVLLISEDLDEILELSDRLKVMSGGQLVYETTPAQADLVTIGTYMAGHE